jgi:hypothetical protein
MIKVSQLYSIHTVLHCGVIYPFINGVRHEMNSACSLQSYIATSAGQRHSASPSQFLVVNSDERWRPCSHSYLGTRIAEFPLVDDVTSAKLPNMNQCA